MAIFASFCLASGAALAETTAPGKIEVTQGHANPNCRMVKHKENGSGIERWFRIQQVQGKDDVAAVVLAALISKRDVTIFWVPGQTTGCGSEPAINYISTF